MALGTEKRRAFAREVFGKLLETRTQRQLAAELRIDQSSVSSAKLTGSIGFDNLRNAAELAGYSLDEIAEAVKVDPVPAREETLRQREAVKSLIESLLEGTTQEALAQELGVEQSAISKAKTLGKLGRETTRKAAELAGIRGADYLELFHGRPIAESIVMQEQRNVESEKAAEARYAQRMARDRALSGIAEEARKAGADDALARLVASAVTEWGLQDVPLIPEAVSELERAKRYLESRAEVLRVRSALGDKKST